MGMTPKEYDCMTYYDFEIKVIGFRNARDWHENLFRTLSFITFKGYADPKKTRSMTLEKFWPLKPQSKQKEKQIPLYKNPSLLKELILKLNNGNNGEIRN